MNMVALAPVLCCCYEGARAGGVCPAAWPCTQVPGSSQDEPCWGFLALPKCSIGYVRAVCGKEGAGGCGTVIQPICPIPTESAPKHRGHWDNFSGLNHSQEPLSCVVIGDPVSAVPCRDPRVALLAS